MERRFVVGPDSNLPAGIVGAREYEAWRSYLEREGQPLLVCTPGVPSFVRATRLPLGADAGGETLYQLEFFDAAAEEALYPGEIPWRTYFLDVHGIEADSTTGLLAALRAQGWPEDRLARYAGIDLDGPVEEGTPEFEEYENHRTDLLQSEDVYLGPCECAFALIRDLTASFPSEAPEGHTAGVFRLLPDRSSLRQAHAVGALSLTLLQELLNAANSGIRVQLRSPTDPPFPQWPDLRV